MSGDDELDAGWDDDAGDNPAAVDTGGLDDGWGDGEDSEEDSLDGGWDGDEADSGDSGSPNSLLAEPDDGLDGGWDDAAGNEAPHAPAGEGAPRWQPYRKKRRPKKRGREARTAADGDIPFQAPTPASSGVKALRKAQRTEQAKRAAGGRSKRAAREAERRRAREQAQPRATKPKKKRAKARPAAKAYASSKAPNNERTPSAVKAAGVSAVKSARKRARSRQEGDEERRSPVPVEQPADRTRNLMILVGALALVAGLAWFLMGSR